MKFAAYIFFILSFFFFFTQQSVFAQQPPSATPTPFNINTTNEGLIECDVCGYCVDRDPPSDWDACAKCLFPDFENPVPNWDTLDANYAKQKRTIKIDQSTGFAPTPKPGRYYTQLGCFSTQGDDMFNAFRGGTGAANPTAQLLNMLFSVVGGIAFLYLLYGAFVIATAKGQPDKLMQGRGIIIAAIVGVIISFSAILLVNIIGGQLLRIPGISSPTPTPTLTPTPTP